ncbi:EVE domain-containing protein [Deinococcus yavapaiensis]|uniref:Putative RNA-binding protein with PUA-like domain n=1 Tax=Deinococcus yavapaiensis KR-236 TaxID=694435 RepID=A0A318SBK6_9DEIO|nr:EVE domain-containing protein [Deinococcus yavapaiensis]PYE55962.1 putative RNA-binding protein with PUA-like domain [Deinococcus yavapaiensis KR-236]
MQRWLLKSEPDVFSYDDLVRVGAEPWTGVRNYQARNFMRAMKQGDLCVFYQSNAKPNAAVGVCSVLREAYEDPTSTEPGRWSAVDVAPVSKFVSLVSLERLRDLPELLACPLIRRGNRLSVLPLTNTEFEAIVAAGGLDPHALDSVPMLH